MFPLYYSTPLICNPVFYAIIENQIEHNLEVKLLPESEILTGLMNGSIPIGYISPLSYAQSKGDLLIVNDFNIFTPHTGKNALLFFKGALDNITRIYFNPHQDSGSFGRFITDWILQETFNISPKWHKVENLTMNAKYLEQYDVIFVEGAEAMDLYPDYDNFIDLSEEWTLNISLPLVQQVLAVPKKFKENEVLEKLRLSRELGLRNLIKIAKSYAKNRPQNWDVYFDILNENYQYHPNPQVWESLSELMSMMFYRNIVDYLPDLKVYQDDL
ncbi:MAG: hypothetical protein JSW33_12625 [bacterium]|nr:MAG: hypothetical protein JSW33_12625 [bacterium]